MTIINNKYIQNTYKYFVNFYAFIIIFFYNLFFFLSRSHGHTLATIFHFQGQPAGSHSIFMGGILPSWMARFWPPFCPLPLARAVSRLPFHLHGRPASGHPSIFMGGQVLAALPPLWATRTSARS